jgi:hypothetical protein
MTNLSPSSILMPRPWSRHARQGASRGHSPSKCEQRAEHLRGRRCLYRDHTTCFHFLVFTVRLDLSWNRLTAREISCPRLEAEAGLPADAETNGRSEAESRQRGSFVEQLGGARTETWRPLAAMVCSALAVTSRHRLAAQSYLSRVVNRLIETQET